MPSSIHLAASPASFCGSLSLSPPQIATSEIVREGGGRRRRLRGEEMAGVLQGKVREVRAMCGETDGKLGTGTLTIALSPTAASVESEFP